MTAERQSCATHGQTQQVDSALGLSCKEPFMDPCGYICQSRIAADVLGTFLASDKPRDGRLQVIWLTYPLRTASNKLKHCCMHQQQQHWPRGHDLAWLEMPLICSVASLAASTPILCSCWSPPLLEAAPPAPRLSKPDPGYRPMRPLCAIWLSAASNFSAAQIPRYSDMLLQ